MGPDLFAITVKPIDLCLDKVTGRSKHDGPTGSGYLHLWKPQRAELRDRIPVRRRGDTYQGPGNKSTTLSVSAEDVSTVLHVSTSQGLE